jgi:predicted alpha/beta hydrolase family esterase
MIIIPGINGSDEVHWQTLWQQAERYHAVRIEPASWADPELEDWLAALDRCFARCKEPPVLLAHSMGCLLVAFWAQRNPGRDCVRGAFLVAPPSPQSPAFPPHVPSFRNVPQSPLPFPSLVVASTNDPFATVDAAQTFALRWGAGFINVGALGHLNSDSNLGEWTEGRHLLDAFIAGTTRF